MEIGKCGIGTNEEMANGNGGDGGGGGVVVVVELAQLAGMLISGYSGSRIYSHMCVCACV